MLINKKIGTAEKEETFIPIDEVLRRLYRAAARAEEKLKREKIAAYWRRYHKIKRKTKRTTKTPVITAFKLIIDCLINNSN